jgi:hypothetical protein
MCEQSTRRKPCFLREDFATQQYLCGSPGRSKVLVSASSLPQRHAPLFASLEPAKGAPVRFPRQVLAILLMTLDGCGLGSQSHSTSWTATLAHAPDASCALQAIAALPEVAGADRHDGAARQWIGVRLPAPWHTIGTDRDGNPFPDIYVLFLHGKSEQFRLDYLGWAQPGTGQATARAMMARDVAARAIIARLAIACAMPELATARENRDAEWMPYLFNI